MRIKKLATFVGCPCFNEFSPPERDFKTKALWSSVGAVVHPLRSLDSDQFLVLPPLRHTTPRLQPRPAVAAGPGHRPVTPCGSAPRPTLRECCAGREGLAPPQGSQAGNLEPRCVSLWPAVCSGRCPQPPIPTWLQWPRLVRERALWSRKRSTPRERGALPGPSPSCFELGCEEIDCCCYALAVILRALGADPSWLTVLVTRISSRDCSPSP